MHNALTFSGIQITDVKKTLLSVVMVGVMLVTTACPLSSSWVSQAESILQVLLPAAINIITLITAFSGKGVNQADVETANKIGSMVQTDLKVVGKLIDDYNAASADKTALLDKINDAVKVAQSDLDTLLPALHITDDALVGKIRAVVGVVLSELASIQALIPLVKSGQNTKAAMKAANVRSAGEFKRLFNTTMLQPTGDVPVDAVAETLVVK